MDNPSPFSWIDASLPLAEVACDHADQALRRRVFANGVAHYVLQCQVCGGHVRSVRKDDPLVRSLAAPPPEFDHALAERWQERQAAAWQERRDRARRDREDRALAWRDAYDVYLLSERWREKRRRRLVLDGGRCRAELDGCLGVATEVHHLSYAHVGNEPLFELASVCAACHREITRMDDERRAS